MSGMVRACAASLAVLLGACAIGAGAGGAGLSLATAWGSGSGVGWEVDSVALPTSIAPGHRGLIEVDVYNTGDAPSSGPVTVTDTLPPGLEATEAGDGPGERDGEHYPETPVLGHSLWSCTGVHVVTCHNNVAGLPSLAGGGGVPFFVEGPDIDPVIGIAVKVAAGAGEGTFDNTVSVAGGGAVREADSTDPVAIGSAAAGFGFVGWHSWFSGADGSVDTQAGSHPYGLTVDFALNTKLVGTERQIAPAGEREARDISVGLPPGFVGDSGAVARCTSQELAREECPDNSQVGYATPRFASRYFNARFLVFNMVPPPSTPLQLGFLEEGVAVHVDAKIRSGSDYGATADANNTAQIGLERFQITVWGNPGDPTHNQWRTIENIGCPELNFTRPRNECEPPGLYPKAYLTMPVACEGPQAISLLANTWQDSELTAQASTQTQQPNGEPAGMTGCENLSFEPSIGGTVDTRRASTPAGADVGLHFPLDGLDEPEELVPSDMKDAHVTLPEGLVINPGRADGLVACSESEAALLALAGGKENDEPAACPGASRLGSALIKSPLLEADTQKEIHGNVYLLASNPPEVKLLVAGSADGVNIKSVGTVHLDQATGRLVTVFENTPQLPASDIDLSFEGGSHGALITPRSCGSYQIATDLAPWSTPYTPDAFPNTAFSLNEGVNGGVCPNGEPFSPSAVSGMTSNQAGAFSPFSVTLSRQDGEQGVNAVSLTLPPGLLPVLKGVERCPEPQASLGTCGANSLIGHTTVAVGAGSDPLYVQGGQVFLTGPYKGAPFGLSVVVPAVAGPFNLGNVIVRAAIGIDPHTGQPTIVSDPLPRILDGVPLQIKTLNVTTDRSGFTFNPTSCEPLSITGNVTSTHGATVGLSSRFQAAGCQSLPFKPTFAVSTQAATSKKQGASLNVKVASTSGQANIHSVAVTLPKQLPSRLTTIQQACTQAVFDQNPATCPAGSSIGTATVNTPILPNPLSGPVYLVSHGGAAFPDIVVILQGEGLTLDLTGSINIKHGVTSSVFASVPDAPVTSFAMQLPEGPHSALAAVLPAKAKGNLCGTTLTMPTTLTGQNGTVLKQNTKITVTGCAKPKKKAKKAKAHTRRAHGKKTKKG